MVRETVSLEGHLIDSDILRRVFARSVEGGGRLEVVEFRIGATNAEPSFARLAVDADEPAALDRILGELSYLGASVRLEDARTAPAEADGILPDEFYASSSYATFVRLAGAWLEERAQKMDCAVVLRDGAPTCVTQRLVRRGEPVVLRGAGIRVRPPERSRGASVFGFMSNEISSEADKPVANAGTARAMRKTRAAGERIAVVIGPAVVHSGGDAALARLVRDGWVDILLSGNAFAVHDLEKAILRTSLGVCQTSGRAVEGGSRNHLFAISAVNRAGGVVPAVESGLVRSGVMYEVVRRRVPFVLAGSIRDDGPLKEVVTDVLEAQLAYARARGRGPVPDARVGAALDRGWQPDAGARPHGARRHHRGVADEARQPRHDARDRARHRRRSLLGATRGGAGGAVWPRATNTGVARVRPLARPVPVRTTVTLRTFRNREPANEERHAWTR